MIAGARIVAPKGFKNFEQGKIYFFLCSDAVSNRVRLVQFLDNGEKITTTLFTLSVATFEEALEDGVLEELVSPDRYPPWLEPIRGVAIAELERRRVANKFSYDEQVNRRFLAISGLVDRAREILTSENPDAIINKHAKEATPEQNQARLRLWFYTYIAFGRDKWTLMPLTFRIGGWDREGSKTNLKLGRPSRKGRNHGYPCDQEMKAKILKGYIKCRSPYKTMNQIYTEILTKEFGCVARKENDSAEFYHRNGEPYPTLAQLRYWIKKQISPKSLRASVKGKNKARGQSGHFGSFSERLTNINQLVEFDGYHISEKLSGLTEGSAVDSFCVVRAVCALSGAIVGIGFSEGKENMEAYKMCLFSMAMNKVKFCELFGVTISPDEWPCEGLPGSIVVDRGPAASYDDDSLVNWLGAIELPPTYSGQSKATIESSHPRDKHTLDQPSYFHSRLNFVLMARREILQVLMDNHTSDASGRMEESMYLSGVKPTPLGIWNYWDVRGRNSANSMVFDTAVRNFLAERPVAIRRDGVFLYGRKYRSSALVDTGIFDRVARKGVISAKAYVLTMCVRHIWVGVAGVLYQLDSVRSHRTVDSDIDISLRDLQEIDRLRLDSAAALRDERAAAQQLHRDRFSKETGGEWYGGERKLGRPSKGGAALQDTADYNEFKGRAK